MKLTCSVPLMFSETMKGLKSGLKIMSGALGKSPKDILSEQEGLNRVLRHLHCVELALGRD